MTDLQKLKATAQATADKCPELLVKVPAGVMVELIRDVERYRAIRDDIPHLDLGMAVLNAQSSCEYDAAVDSEMNMETEN